MRRGAPGLRRLGQTLIAALVLSLLSAAGLATPASAVGTASISGKVSVPTGVDATKIQVSAVQSRFHSVYAGADGTYTISGLDAGTYYVGFNYHGNSASPVVNAQYSGGPVAVAADAAVTGIDQTLQPAAIVSGTISVPQGSAPFNGSVEVLGGPAFGTYAGSVPVDPMGAFTVGGVAPGTYKVRYRGTADWATMWHGGVATASASPSITLVEGTSNPSITDAAVAGASIAGSLTGGDGQYQLVEAVASDGQVAASMWVNTGAYSVSSLFPGSYTMQFNRASGVTTTAEAQYYNNLPEGSGAQGATPVNAAAGTTTGIDAALQVGGTLTGKVAGAQGEALANVPVRVYTKDGSLVTRGTNTGADGTFTVTGLTTGSYLVAANMIATRPTGSLGQIFSGNVLSEAAASGVSTTVGQNTDIGTLSFATAGGTGTPVFTDVPAGSPFATEITWLAEQGISRGWSEADGSTTYRPWEPIHRNAMAAFMYRLAGEPEFTEPAVSPFTDVPVGGPFYKEIT